MATPDSRFAIPYPCRYTTFPSRLTATLQPGESGLFHSAKTSSTLPAADPVCDLSHAPRVVIKIALRAISRILAFACCIAAVRSNPRNLTHGFDFRTFEALFSGQIYREISSPAAPTVGPFVIAPTQ